MKRHASMNRIYRLIWSQVLNAWVAVAENTKGQGKSSSRKLSAALALTGSLFLSPLAMAGPAGGQVVAGTATINQTASTTTISQSTQNLSVNWQSFNIAPTETVNFAQPSATAIAVNRVLGNNGTQILGHLNANGQVYLINPNGVVFGQGAQVNVGGLVASTLDIGSNSNGVVSFAGSGTGSIVNQGTINAANGGYVAFIGNAVSNTGKITAPMGSVGLAAGSAATLTFAGGSMVKIQVDQSVLNSLAGNGGLIQANGGMVILSAGAKDALLASVVNNTGVIEAQSIQNHNGTITLSGGASAGTVNVGGTLDASSATGAGGQVVATAQSVVVNDGAKIDATGAAGGGTINIGGGWQGGGGIPQATTVYVASTATLDASATGNGNGGLISVWSDITNAGSASKVYGTLLARGGINGGNGGSIETSGHQVDIGTASVDASAPKGSGGQWLIDPYDYTINSAAATTITNSLDASTSVTVDTSSAGGPGAGASGNGDINVNAAIAKTSGGDATLTLKAARHVVFNNAADISSASGKLNLLLWADSGNTGNGIIEVSNSSISTNGGYLSFGNNQTATISGVSTLVGGDVFFNSPNAQTISTAGGAVDVYGETIVGNSSASGLTIDTAGGNVAFHGLLNSGNQYAFVSGSTVTGNGYANSWAGAQQDSLAGNGSLAPTDAGYSYMVTITSRLENSIAGLAANYQGAWIGAYRPNTANGNWVWANGPEQGQQFFTQPQNGYSGTTMPGYYSNFGSGEPNGCMTSASCEHVGQFFGTAGQWNDLSATTTFSATQSNQYAVLGYVRETNSAPSAVTINAGNGSVAFSGTVGSSKALSSLTVNAASATLPNGVTTSGTQTYNSAVRLVTDTTLTTTNSDITFASTVNSADPASPKSLTTNILADPTYYWVDWTSSDANHVYGTITIGGNTINVTYTNTNGYAFAQTAGGTNYWTGYLGGAFSGASPYVSASVANGPATADIIALQYAGSQSLTFSQSVENLAFSIVSMNGNGYGFNQNFNIASYSGYNGAGPGYYGAGTMVKAVVGNTYQLNDGGMNAASIGHSEPHGTIRFTGGFSQLNWQSLSNENWNGFTVGVSGTSASAGKVHFNGAAGGTAALGAITVNGAMQTTADISAAASLSVTGNSTLGGNITTTGDQNYGSAVTLNSNATLTTTSNGSVSTTSTIDGAHNLTVSTNGTGSTTFKGTVGGTTALTGLNVTTDVLNAGAIALAPSSALNITNSGASEVTGIISGTGVTLTKAGSGTLTLTDNSSYTSATNIAAGGLILQNDAPTHATSSFSGAGTLTIQSASPSFTGTFTTSGWNFGSTLGGLTIGRTTNTQDVTVSSAQSINGPISLYGGNININSNLASTASGAAILVKGTGDITQASAASVTTNNGAVTYWANALGTGGNIWLKGTGAAGASINTGGGNITLSGGTDVTTGYAQGDATNSSGVLLDTATLNSGGGNIVIRGKGATSNVSVTTSAGSIGNNNGIRLISGNTINSGSGTIDMEGVAVGNAAAQASNGIETNQTGYSKILSAATNTTAITLFGDASSGTNSGNSWGTFLWGGNASGIVIAATGTGGGISLNGKGGSIATGAAGTHLEPNAFVLAASGPILISGTAGAASSYADVDINSTIGFIGSLPGGFGMSSPVTSSSSNISITTDTLSANHIFGGGTFSGSAVQSSGILTIAPRTTGKAMAVQTSAPASGTDWINPSSMFGSSGLFKTGFSSLVFGSSTTGNVTLDNYTFDNPTTLNTSGNAILGAISIANNDLTLNMTGSGSITQTGAVAVSRLDLNGSTSAVTLNTTTNAIGTLAANVASLSLINGGALSIGTVGATSGISASGTISVATTSGNLTVAQNVSTSDTSSSALVLGAGTADAVGTTVDNIVLSGSPTVSVGTNGRAILYTGSVSGSTGVTGLTGSGSGNFRYDSKAGTSNFTSALGASGTYAVYREQPTLYVTSGNQGMTYGGTTPTFTAGYSGYINGDASPGVLSATAVWNIAGATSTSGNYVAGDHAVTYSSGLSGGLGYGFANDVASAGLLTVSKLALTGAIATGVTTYGAALTPGAASFSNAVTNDVLGTVTVSVNTTGNTSTSSNLKAGGHTGIESVSALSGGDAGNYTYSNIAGNYTVNTLALNVTGTTAANRNYDGTTNVALSGASISGVGNDVVTLGNSYAGTVANANVANSKAVSTAMTISGADAANYALTQPSGLTVNITPAPLTVTANADAKFVTQADTAGYNGVSYSGLVNAETNSVLGGALSVSRSNSGSNGAGTYAGVLVPGGLTSSNYSIGYASGSYTIVPADQLLVKVGNATSTYGAAPGYSIASVQYLNNSSVITNLSNSSVNGNTYTYSDGAGGGVTFTLAPANAAIGTSGNINAGNYALTGANSSITGNNFNALNFVGNLAVTQKSVSATASNVSKVYDGTTAMNAMNMGLTGLVTGDTVTVSGSGAFSQKNAGSNLNYEIANIRLGSTDSGNYYLSGGSTFTGSNGVITAKPITVVASSANKVYDGNTISAVTLASADVVAGDMVTFGDTSATFADKNAGIGKTVTVSGISAGSTDAGNYSVNTTATTSADITQLGSVNWIGPVTGGNWSDPANWAGGAIPDLSNVANVVIPNGSNVHFDSTVAGPVNLNQIGSGGLTLTGGTLNVSNALDLQNYSQSGGTVGGTGSFTVNNSFTQTGGVIDVGGNVYINQTTGPVTLGDIVSGGDMSVISAGGIGQNPGSALTVQGNSTLSGGAIVLNNPGNALTGTVTASGNDITLNNGHTDLTVVLNDSGASRLSTTGALIVSGRENGLTTNAAATMFGANTINGNLSVTADGAVTQTGPIQVTGDAYIKSGRGGIVLISSGNIFKGKLNASGSPVSIVGYDSGLSSAARNATVQLETNVMSFQSGSQPQAISISPGIKVSRVSTSGNSAESGGDSSSGAVANTAMVLGSQGASLRIVNGGVRVPNEMASLDSGSIPPFNLIQEPGAGNLP